MSVLNTDLSKSNRKLGLLQRYIGNNIIYILRAIRIEIAWTVFVKHIIYTFP